MKKIVYLPFIAALLCPCFAQTNRVQASVAGQRTITCREVTTGNFESHISTQFTFENLSNRRILVAKTIEIIPSIRVASSPEDIENKKFLANINEEYSIGNQKLAPPKLADFVAIEPGGKQVVSVASVTISASNTLSTASGARLPPGKYWVQLGLSTLPAYFTWNHPAVSRYRNKWQSTGYLMEKTVWTEAFPVTLTLEENAGVCASH